MNTAPPLPLTWLAPGQPFPPVEQAWGADSPASGLLAAGHGLDADMLIDAYQRGIFPWFSPGQPVMWWSPDPRMVLPLQAFKCRRSLLQSLRRWTAQDDCQLCFDKDFTQVMHRCAGKMRPGQAGTWIVPRMIEAYSELHRRGLAHSAEVWQDGRLVAGLYFVALGHSGQRGSQAPHTAD